MTALPGLRRRADAIMLCLRDGISSGDLTPQTAAVLNYRMVYDLNRQEKELAALVADIKRRNKP